MMETPQIAYGSQITPYTWGVMCFLSSIIVPSLVIILQSIGILVKPVDAGLYQIWGIALASGAVVASVQLPMLKQFGISWITCYRLIIVGFIILAFINQAIFGEFQRFNTTSESILYYLTIAFIRAVVISVMYFVIFYSSLIERINQWVLYGGIAMSLMDFIDVLIRYIEIKLILR